MTQRLNIDVVGRVDAAIVGSDVSGSDAAMTAVRAWTRAALPEKSQTFGGSAALSAGMFALRR
ncbi:hypothetical protein [Georgenia sp. SYP-B2076]|uniref:hypothetical protein n=1 Tax=Georgenia sp. SYP-B2076 TaxID=2495881 RepID=UPI000F8D5FA3|nr:hypothetical protein [Georgenia sp. SYP-B2076]